MKIHQNAWEHFGFTQKHAAPRGSVAVWLMNSIAVIALMLDTHRSRSHLHNLTDEELRDIGIDRVDAMQEAHRAFWDIDGVK